MTKLLAFNQSSNKVVLRNVDTLNVLEISTDYPWFTPAGRLTLSSSNSIADGTDQTTIYYLPHAGAIVPLWNNATTQWVYRLISNVSLNIGANTGVNLPYDLYAYLQADGSMGFAGYYWSTATARSVALSQRHGLYYLSGIQTNDCTFLGTAHLTGTSGAAKVNDSVTQRLLWNAYNQVNKRVLRFDQGTSWAYTSNTWRPFNNNTANRIQVVDGAGNGVIDLSFVARVAPASGNFGQIGIGLDITNNFTDAYAVFVSDSNASPRCSRTVGAGYHYLQAVEATGNNGSSTTYYGANYNGLIGNWSC